MFQHTATRRRLPSSLSSDTLFSLFQHTATRRRLRELSINKVITALVSTHSHPKAAANLTGFYIQIMRFQHTATRRRLRELSINKVITALVSTHSHPKAAANLTGFYIQIMRFQHTATRRRLHSHTQPYLIYSQSFNTQPPEGGCRKIHADRILNLGFNTQPPEGGCWC
mgnify:CR=1 FL=1